MPEIPAVCPKCDEVESTLADEEAVHAETLQMLELSKSQITTLTAEKNRLSEAVERLLLSRDASWIGGHDWQEAVDGAIEILAVYRSQPASQPQAKPRLTREEHVHQMRRELIRMGYSDAFGDMTKLANFSAGLIYGKDGE